MRWRGRVEEIEGERGEHVDSAGGESRRVRDQFRGAEYAFHATVISVLQKTEGAGGCRKAISASDHARGGWRERRWQQKGEDEIARSGGGVVISGEDAFSRRLRPHSLGYHVLYSVWFPSRRRHRR